MKCVLHIGTEKTGTTILQNWLYFNQSILSHNGIFLSNRIGKTNNRLIPAFFQTHFDEWAKSNSISNNNEKNLFFKNFLSDFSSEIIKASRKHNTFVITSEHLHSRLTKHEEVEALNIFLKKYFNQIEVVCYFRSQFDLAVSRYSTSLKAHLSASLDAVIDNINPDNHYYNYAKVADLWSGVFGKENCIFRLYNSGHFLDGDIRKDFLSLIDSTLSFEILDNRISSANESLTPLQAATYRVINKHIPLWLGKNSGKNSVNIQAKEMFSELESLKIGKIYSSKEREIQKRFEEVNDYFFWEYFRTNNQFSNRNSFPSENKQHISLEQVIDIVEDVVRTALIINSSVSLFSKND